MISRFLGTAATLAVLVALASQAKAQTSTSTEEPTLAALSGRASAFFEGVSSEKVTEAFGTLLAGSQLAKNDRAEQLATLMKKTKELETNYGIYRNHERLAAKRIGTDLVVLKYLYKCENYPVVWHLVFYRDQREARSTETTTTSFDTWRVISLRFDTDLEALAR